MEQCRPVQAKQSYFILLSPSGRPQALVPLLTAHQNYEYEQMMAQPPEKVLPAIKEEEESTNELEFEPFIPVFRSISEQ